MHRTESGLLWDRKIHCLLACLYSSLAWKLYRPGNEGVKQRHATKILLAISAVNGSGMPFKTSCLEVRARGQSVSLFLSIAIDFM